MTASTLAHLSLVLGGAASGKSALAERLVAGSGRAPVYVATARASDAEMTAKIAAHRARRGPQWRTVEAPLEPGQAIAAASRDEAVLMDCATLWLSNLLLAEADLDAEIARFLGAVEAAPCPVVVVSNEVGMGIVPEHALARRFREAQGRLNQELAARAGLVVAVIAGLPLVLRGTLPAPCP